LSLPVPALPASRRLCPDPGASLTPPVGDAARPPGVRRVIQRRGRQYVGVVRGFAPFGSEGAFSEVAGVASRIAEAGAFAGLLRVEEEAGPAMSDLEASLPRASPAALQAAQDILRRRREQGTEGGFRFAMDGPDEATAAARESTAGELGESSDEGDDGGAWEGRGVDEDEGDEEDEEEGEDLVNVDAPAAPAAGRRRRGGRRADAGDGTPSNAGPKVVFRDESLLRQHEEWIRSLEKGDLENGEWDKIAAAASQDGDSDGGGGGDGGGGEAAAARGRAGAAPRAGAALADAAQRGLVSLLTVEHLVPLVPEIITVIDTEHGVVVVDLPRGLLDVGRRPLLLQWLRREIEPYVTARGAPSPAGDEDPGADAWAQHAGGSAALMPTRSELEKAGRGDVIAAVQRCGGFLEVAVQLGLRARRRPAGYWDDEEVLMEEISRFVAAHWVEMTDESESGRTEKYFYNMVTAQVRFGEPQEPLKLPLDEDGSFVWVEDEEDRVMPSESSVKAAGRYDLHHAVLRHGGYSEVARSLDRRPSWPRVDLERDAAMVAGAILSVAEENQLPRGVLPSVGMLLDAGRADIAQAIVRVGGAANAAAMLGMQQIRNPRGYWDDPARAAHAALLFAAKRHGLEAGVGEDDFDAAEPEALREALAGLREAARRGAWVMPSDRELREAGRLDLRYALQKLDRGEVAEIAGLRPRSRGRPKK